MDTFCITTSDGKFIALNNLMTRGDVSRPVGEDLRDFWLIYIRKSFHGQKSEPNIQSNSSDILVDIGPKCLSFLQI